MNIKHTILLISILLITPFVHATDTLVVGIKESKPFAYKNSTDEWTGYSVEMLKYLTTQPLQFKEYKNNPSMLEDLHNNKTDIAISAISITKDREDIVNFTYPYFTTSMGIAALQEPNNWWWLNIFKILGFLLIGLYIIGFIIDRLDGNDNIHNAHDGAWWALVTFTTTGYGDMVPNTPTGKLIAAGWMIASLFLLSLFTGYVASSMTVHKLSNDSWTINDLYKHKVTTISGSSSELALTKLGVDFNTVPTIPDAINSLKTKSTDAVVYDKVMLDYEASKDSMLQIHDGDTFTEWYAVALPDKSKHTEYFNKRVIEFNNSSLKKMLTTKYF